MWRSGRKYIERVESGLDEALAKAAVESLPLSGPRLVLFSDLHRGVGDRADDFRSCRKIYHAALGYYDALEYRLALLGDVEELWQRLLVGIVDHYEGTLELERRFFEQGRGVRVLGNHDETLAWPWNRSVLDKYTGNAPLYEGLLLRLSDDSGQVAGEILLVHGHQGIRYTWLDRFVVRRVWSPVQRLTGIRLGTPAGDHSIRNTHEMALYRWASRRPGLLLICGHTHHPVFMSSAWEESVRANIEDLRRSGAAAETLAMKEAELHWIAAEMEEMRSSLPDNPRPCFFNTGCCSFSDGSITGIEIDAGRIRLIRWSGESGAPLRECLREADLADIFNTWRPGDRSEGAADERVKERRGG